MTLRPLIAALMSLTTAAQGQGMTPGSGALQPCQTFGGAISGIWDFTAQNADPAADPNNALAMAKPWVQGIYVRCPWSAIQPDATVATYVWSCVDTDIDYAKSYGKGVLLAVFQNSIPVGAQGSGVNAAEPSNFTSAGIPYLPIVMTGVQAVCGVQGYAPIYWSTQWMATWDAVIDALKAHLVATGRLSAIKGIAFEGVADHSAENIFGLSNSSTSDGAVGTCSPSKIDGVSTVTAPDLHVYWQTLNGSVSPGAGYTATKMLNTLEHFLDKEVADFPGVPVFRMSGNVVIGKPPYNGAFPGVDFSGNLAESSTEFANLGNTDFATYAIGKMGANYCIQSNDFHGGDDTSHGLNLISIQTNIQLGGCGGMQEGQTILNSDGSLNTNCPQNGGDPGTCDAATEQKRGGNYLLKYTVQYSQWHPSDIALLPDAPFVTYLRGCYQ